MDSPELWQWIWLAAALVFFLGEMTTAGSFFLLPFGIGAAVADTLAFGESSLGWQWAAFVAVSGAAFASMRPLARRVAASTAGPSGVGADRWVGKRGVVLEAIPAGIHEVGLVRVDREEWRAESEGGIPLAAGTPVVVVGLAGTRVVVAQVPNADSEV